MIYIVLNIDMVAPALSSIYEVNAAGIHGLSEV